MRIPHATALLAAITVVACSSQDSQANGASAQAPVTATATAAVAVAPAPTTLKAAMKAIEDDWKKVEAAIDALKKGAEPDLAATEAAARRVAQAMHFAYDPFEDKEVPNFAVMAKEAEAALNAFADGAKNGKKDALQELGKTLQEQHCARCHDATEEAKG
ncbi:MAG: hypothetical protein RLZZ562_2394 [Planctomycetota bacterium]